MKMATVFLVLVCSGLVAAPTRADAATVEVQQVAHRDLG